MLDIECVMQRVMELDDFSTYRALCTNRLQRLERYKKARSFCNLEENSTEASTSEKRLSEVPHSSYPFCVEESEGEFYDKENTSYEVIRNKMMELMENDMAILQQLLNLGDQVAAMKKKKEGLRRTQSTNSMERAEEEDEFDDHYEPPFSASMSAVTNLFVEDDLPPQYFSRQNSVLRIPIQPRRSNRFGSRRVPRRPSEIIRPSPATRNLRVTTDESSSESSSDGLASPLSHTPSTVSYKSSITYSSSSASDSVGKKSRSSNSSIDSGIRESSDSPSPTFDRQI